MEFIEQGVVEWDVMWQTLASNQLNADLAEPHVARNLVSGEAWQYMGTHDGIHNFRHRDHPKTQRREIIQFPSTSLMVQLAPGVKLFTRDGRRIGNAEIVGISEGTGRLSGQKIYEIKTDYGNSARLTARKVVEAFHLTRE